MVSENVSMLIGATVTAGVDAGLEGYANINPAVKSQVPYLVIHPAIPPLNCLLADAGIPLVLYGIGKLTKKPFLKNMAKGGAIYGFSEIVGQTLYRVALVAQGVTPMSYVIRR